MEDQLRALVREEALKVFAEQSQNIISVHKQSQLSPYIGIKDASVLINVSSPTLYRAIKAGHLSLHKFGGKSFLDRAEVNNLFIKVK